MLHVIIVVGQHELSVVPLMSSLHDSRLVGRLHGVRRLRTFPSAHESRSYTLSVRRANHGRLIAAARLGTRSLVQLDWLAVLVILLEHQMTEVTG